MSGEEKEPENRDKARMGRGRVTAGRSVSRGVSVSVSEGGSVSTSAGSAASWTESDHQTFTGENPEGRNWKSPEWQLLRREIHRLTGEGAETEIAGLVAGTEGDGRATLTLELPFERLSPEVQRLLRGGGEE